MDRRALLRATGTALAATAGCLGFGRGGTYRFEVEPVGSLADLVATQPDEFTAAQRDAVDGMLDDGRHVTAGHQPFVDGAHVEADGRFYRLRTDRTGSTTVTRTVLGATLVGDPPGEVVSVDAYPDVDREPIVIAYRMAVTRARDDEGRPPEHGYVYVFRTAAPETSALLPTPEHPYVEVADETVRLWTERRDVEEAVYEATAEEVAATEATFRRYARERFVVDLDAASLTADQREIVESAIETGAYEDEGRLSAAMDDLLDVLYDHPSSSRFPLFEYEGRGYRWAFHGGE